MPRKKREAGHSDESKRFREKIREQMEDSNASPKDPDDPVDAMVRLNVKLHGP